MHCCSPITEKNFFLTTRGTTWRLLIRLLAQARIKYMMIYELEKPWHWLLGLKHVFEPMYVFGTYTHSLSGTGTVTVTDTVGGDAGQLE